MPSEIQVIRLQNGNFQTNTDSGLIGYDTKIPNADCTNGCITYPRLNWSWLYQIVRLKKLISAKVSQPDN